MKQLPLGPLYYEFSRHNEPRLRIAPGETVLVETEDAFSGQVRTNDDRRDKKLKPYGNPQTGPIWVEGAAAGDTLAVKIESIEPSIGQCATRTSDPRQLSEWLGTDCPHGTHVCPIRDGLIYWSDDLTIPYRPMLGCIGTAPDTGVPTTGPAGPHGGNMDIIETAPGNIVYLPVFVAGAYLYLGDAHAAMGHGELSASGLEMPSHTTITVELIKDKKIAGPRIESPDEIMTIATGCPMERATAEAYARLILWMEAEYGWDRWRAYDLLTHAGQISVGYYA
ncbi:MAG: acetamidase/formamidase family protein, partial [Planctomycetota bacterium]